MSKRSRCTRPAEEDARPQGERPEPSHDARGGSSRREFLLGAATTGAILSLGPGDRASASPTEGPEAVNWSLGWEWVDPDEPYDPDYDYIFVYETGLEAQWEPVEDPDEYDPEYEYLYAYVPEDESLVAYVPEDASLVGEEDGTLVEWEDVDPSEAIDPEAYIYVYEDGTPVEWEPVPWEPETVEELMEQLLDPTYNPDYYYMSEYEYVDDEGKPSQWEWVEDPEEDDPNSYDYVYNASWPQFEYPVAR